VTPPAIRRTAANRIDVATRLCVRTTAARRVFPSGEALPSTTSAGRYPPLFGRFLDTTASSDFSSAYMLGVAAFAFPSRPGTCPGTGETSQVPDNELLHVHKVYDCARFSPCKPIHHGTMLPSLPQNEIGTSELDPFRSSILGPWNASRLPSRAEPPASLGVGAVG
jgi:hypothetical protein